MRNIFRKLGVTAGILCITGALVMSIIYGLTVGNFIAFSIGVALIALAIWFRKLPKWLKRMIIILISAGIIFFIIMTTVIVKSGNDNTAGFKEDCVLVLGCGIRGEEVLPTLQSRLDKCLEYHSANPSAVVFLTGGQGRNESIPEAVAMKRYLLKNGVPERQIITEEKSRNTQENFIYSHQLLDNYFNDGKYTVACITSDYHMFRTKRIASDQGININTYSAGIQWYLRPSAYTREVLSILKYWTGL